MGKGLFFINTKTYSPILLILPLLVNIIFLSDYIPLQFKNIEAKLWKKATIIVILTIGSVFLSRNIINCLNEKTILLKTSRGIFYADSYAGPAFKELISYLNQQTDKNSTFFVVPETHLLNFLLDRSTGAVNFCTASYWGEEQMYQFIKSSPPDYIVMLLDWGKPPYNENMVKESYGLKFYNYIMENYKLDKVFIRNVRLVIYKKRPRQKENESD